MTEKRFLQGFIVALATLGAVLAAFDLLLVKVGEINLSHVVERQLAAPDGAVLFSSGINQHAYTYKIMLYDRTAPTVVALGSSRAMELHAQFFREPFVTLGGATSNVTELASVVQHLAQAAHPPKLAIVVVDPWWFNARYAGNRPGYEGGETPNIISADLLSAALRAFYHGNWIARSLVSRNLGIFSILEDEGFARDGSYRNDGTTSGTHPSTDVGFAHTFARIAGDSDRFERNAHASPALVQRGCDALNALKAKAGHVVIVAPPFARPVWRRMMQGGYAYVAEAYDMLHACTPDIPFFNYVDQASIAGTSDCEFVDGLHPGDVANARELEQIAQADPQTRSHVDTAFLANFIRRYSGNVSGISLLEHPTLAEVDFLKLGCVKAAAALRETR